VLAEFIDKRERSVTTLIQLEAIRTLGLNDSEWVEALPNSDTTPMTCYLQEALILQGKVQLNWNLELDHPGCSDSEQMSHGVPTGRDMLMQGRVALVKLLWEFITQHESESCCDVCEVDWPLSSLRGGELPILREQCAVTVGSRGKPLLQHCEGGHQFQHRLGVSLGMGTMPDRGDETYTRSSRLRAQIMPPGKFSMPSHRMALQALLEIAVCNANWEGDFFKSSAQIAIFARGNVE
jgi:hypothetical protein